MIEKIISGGQTGAEQAGLAAAEMAGIETGGWAPKGYQTENGKNPELLRDQYGLEESEGGYNKTTHRNVLESDGTALFGNMNSPGSKLTIEDCRCERKPYIVNPSPAALRDFVTNYDIMTLNVAGNSFSINNNISELVVAVINCAFNEPSLF